MVRKDELKTCFQFFDCNVEDDAVLLKCMDLCDLWDVNEETFVEKWVAFCAGHSITNLDPTLASLLEMERAESESSKNKTNLKAKQILENVDSPAFKQTKTKYSVVHPYIQYSDNDNILEMYGCNQAATPKVKRLRSPDTDVVATEERKLRAVESTFTPLTYTPKSNTPSRYPTAASRGKTLLTFGEEVSSWKNHLEYAAQVCKVEKVCVPSDAMYMFEMLSRKGPILTFVCESIGERLLSLWYRQKDTSVRYTKNVRTHTDSLFRTFGMIRCDAGSIYLEGCKRSITTRKTPVVELDLSAIKQYSVYPGQIVAVECTNSTGNRLNVKDMFVKGYAPKSKPPKLAKQLNVVVAAGPFTANDNLNYQPLWDLMERVRDEGPHVLILIGPFLDCAHPEIENATIKHTFQELFEMLVKKIVDQIKGKSIQVVLVPSNRDAHHEPIFPTSEYFLPKSLSVSNIHLMSDPCVINIEGLVIGATSVDALRHLSSEETSNTSAMDRLSRLADHILSQNCFYPLYPPVEDLSVDTILWEKYAFFDEQPHLMILPSDMRYFYKIVNDSAILNPERLQKYIYAKLCVRPTVGERWTAQNNISCEVVRV